MFNRVYRKIGAYLGMLAIVLSIGAPIVSQELRALQGGLPALDAAFCSANQAAPANLPAADDTSRSAPVKQMDACAYCGMVAHLVGLPSTPPMPGLVLASSWFAAPRLAAAFRPYLVVTPAQPRAPPDLT